MTPALLRAVHVQPSLGLEMPGHGAHNGNKSKNSSSENRAAAGLHEELDLLGMEQAPEAAAAPPHNLALAE